jgi:amino acid transporter
MHEEPALRRELGLRDVTLFTISCIVGVRWVTTAAHAGPGTITLWIAAAILFVAPLAVCVAALSAKYPGSGGLYYWTRGDFGPWHGFLCFWIYWLGLCFWFPTASMFYVSIAVYGLGPSFAPFADNRAVLIGAALMAMWVALGTNLVGMKIGKWTENVGASAMWVIAGLFAILAAIAYAKHGSATRLDIVPKWSFNTLNLGVATIAYAMTGFELTALMGAEIKDPARTLPSAGWIASGFATIFYSAMTLSLLILLEPSKIDERYGLTQAAAQFSSPVVTSIAAILVLLSGMGQFGGIGSSVSRLPFAVGVDKLLPPAFAKIHPRWHTPHVSIICLGIVASFLLVVFQLGDTLRAAYDTLVSLMVIAGFLPYIYIFGSAWKAGKRLSASSGWLVTALALICSVIPTGQVTRPWLYELKLAAATTAMIVTARLLYRRTPPVRAGWDTGENVRPQS